MREYAIDSHILSVWGIRDLTDASNAASMGPILDWRYSSRLNDVVGTADATFNAVEAGGDTDSLTGAKAAADCSRTAMSAARYVNLAMFSIVEYCCVNQQPIC